MEVTKELIRKTAHLSRLQFSDEEEMKMGQDMTKIIDWMDKLNELDTTQVEPLIHIRSELNRLRPDIAEEPLYHDRALVNAPKKDSNYFRVPKVIE
jgi:aspartyl-tRNA(Asn)/glutamyl-tRNA(Gln) amidotransferase subunit C